MNKRDTRSEYLRKADEAEEQAKSARSPAAKAAWERIAKDYRELARLSGSQP